MFKLGSIRVLNVTQRRVVIDESRRYEVIQLEHVSIYIQ